MLHVAGPVPVYCPDYPVTYLLGRCGLQPADRAAHLIVMVTHISLPFVSMR
jgi:hypothetical protein